MSKLKEFIGKYGIIGASTFLGAALINYSAVYIAVKEGVDFRGIAKKVNYETTEERWQQIESLGPAAAAYLIYKAMAPLRYPVVFGLTPIIVKALKR